MVLTWLIKEVFYSYKKNQKREYGKNRYLNMSEEKKNKTKRISKIIVRLKNLNIIMNKIVF